MDLKRIRLELARDRDYPEGSRNHGYEFAAPLTEAGHIDAEAWRAARERCRVRRYWAGEPDMVGHLVHKPGGSWGFHYDIRGNAAEDESGYRFNDHAFKPGEYVSIKEHDDVLRTFRVTVVRPLD